MYMMYNSLIELTKLAVLPLALDFFAVEAVEDAVSLDHAVHEGALELLAVGELEDALAVHFAFLELA